VRHLYDNFETILEDTINPPEEKEYLKKIHSDNHLETCKDSCYECLKVYRNMNYHSLLDWRLALSMLRIMRDESFVCGADKNFDFLELRDWLNTTKWHRDKFARSFFEKASCEEIGGLPIIRWQKQKSIIVFIHPFWNVTNLNYNENWLAKTFTEIRKQVTISGGSLSIIDTFNLLRRPGWCYEKLVIKL
jgi:hypothetical protein